MIFGWAACSLGIAGVILACCVCCTDCCTRKTDVPITAPPVSLQTLGRQSEVEWQLHVAAAWCLSSAFSCRRLGSADFWGPVLGHHRCHIQKPPPTGFLPYLSSSSIISFGSVSISTQCEVFELAWQTKHNFLSFKLLLEPSPFWFNMCSQSCMFWLEKGGCGVHTMYSCVGLDARHLLLTGPGAPCQTDNMFQTILTAASTFHAI